MQATLDCFPCFLRQALQASRFAKANETTQRRIVDRAFGQLQNAPSAGSPLEIASAIYEMVCRETEEPDPYRSAKEASNAEALRWRATLQGLLKKSDDPLGLALKASVAGNIMDYGALARFELSSLVEQLHRHEFTINDRPTLESRLRSARSLTYFTDNAGEIVFDHLLLEQIVKLFPIEKIRLVVRSKPFLNDALEEDALAVGITRIPGLELHALPISPSDHEPADWARATCSDATIAKGMANFENYSEFEGFHFLFIAKCGVISRLLRERCGQPISEGDWILHQPRPAPRSLRSCDREPLPQLLEP